MKTKYTAVNEYIKIPQELRNELQKCGLELIRSEKYFYKFNKPIFLADKIQDKNVDFYLNYYDDSVSRINRTKNPVGNILYAEEYCYNNDINFLTVTDEDIRRYGYEFVSQCVLHKILDFAEDDSWKEELIDFSVSGNKIDILYNNQYAGFVEFELSNTIVNFYEWCSYIDPEYWIDKLTRELFPTVLMYKIFTHPYDFKPVSQLYRTGVGMSNCLYNSKITSTDNSNKRMYRSLGIKVIRNPNKNYKERKTSHSSYTWYPHEKELKKRVCKEQDKIRNNELLMSKIVDKSDESIDRSSNSHDYAEFTCHRGHTYWGSIKEQKVYNCPVCTGDVVIPGVNDIATTHPEKSKNWDYNLNFPYKPEHVTQGSMRRFYWICHSSKASYLSEVNSIMKPGIRKTPFESNLIIHKGYNDFATLYPKLADLFSPENNVNFSELTRGDVQNTYIWRCKNCNHIWKRQLTSMINLGECTYCAGYGKCISKPEKELSDFIRSVVKCDVYTNDRTLLNHREIDVYLPDMKLAFEYNGLFWHSDFIIEDTSFHSRKWKDCYSQEVVLFSVWDNKWYDNRDLVTAHITNILSPFNPMYYYDCDVIEVDFSYAQKYFKENSMYMYLNDDRFFTIVKNDEVLDMIGISYIGDYPLLKFYNHKRRNVNDENIDIVREVVGKLFDCDDILLYCELGIDSPCSNYPIFKRGINAINFKSRTILPNNKTYGSKNTIHSYGYHLYRI